MAAVVLDQEPDYREVVALICRRLGLQPLCVDDSDRLLEALSDPGLHLVIADADALGGADGIAMVRRRTDLPLVVLGGGPTERYLEAGADAIYVEGPRDDKELAEIGKAFAGRPLVTTMMEGGGKTPWHPPSEFAEMGYSMILYPTSILFRAARAMERAVADLRAGRRLDMKEAMSKDEFMKLVGLEYWQGVEKKFHP